MMATIACVLRSGGEYGPEHVAWLRNQVAQHLPKTVRFVCFSDVDVPCERVQLVHKFPGWWAKIELFRTLSLPGDLLYFDLDTVLVDDCRPLLHRQATTALTDVYGGGTLQSSVMYLDEDDRKLLWDEFMRNPDAHMHSCAGGGDQTFIGRTLAVWRCWQNVLPGALVSYKVDMVRANMKQPPQGARVVVFHGRPRPWQVNQEWIPKL